jgi:hypothetical protein
MIKFVIVYLIGVAVHLLLLGFAARKYQEQPGWRAAFFVVFWPLTFVVALGVGYAETCT